ncbi:MAG: hypothetical protein JXA79_12395 [Deltaproteobacteria bacterium]|nr:hypothetical protein [Deltaproteobacteria bacterium]
MKSEDIEQIAKATAEGLQEFVESSCAALDKMTAQATKQPDQQKTEVSPSVKRWVENRPENDQDPKDVSSSAKAFIKDQANPEGKSLGLKEDPGPTMEHGTLLGKTI